jgi:membrane protease subunit HflK
VGAVYKPKVTRVNRVEVGFRSSPQQGRGRGGAARDVPQESLMLTGDENIIDVQSVVFWVIKDAGKFLFNIRNPEQTVKDASESALREIIGKTSFEFIRTKGRVAIEDEAKVLVQSILDDYGAGIEVTDVQLQKVDPPGTVLAAFRDVQAARADKERAVNEATAYLNENIQRAEGEAQKIVKGAEAYREQKIAVATGESQRFLSIYAQYLKDKEVTRRRLYLEAIKGIMKDMDKVMIDGQGGGSGVVPYLPLDELLRGRQGTAGGEGG